VNRVTFPADTPGVRSSAPENYFVRLDPDPGAVPPSARGRKRGRATNEWSAPTPRHKRRHKRVNGRLVLAVILLSGMGMWSAWASQQPGGVSGTINGFIDHVRGEVQDASAGPSLKHAAKYFNEQYGQNGQYPRPTEEQLTSAGIGVDLDIADCGGQAVVLRTLTVSRLLLAGKDLGEVSGKQNCPADLDNPSPWKSSK
jgi:hypothetical protein